MKKIFSSTLFCLGLIAPTVTFCQGLQVNPPSDSPNKIVFVPHSLYPATFLFNEPQVLSIELSDNGEKIVKLLRSAETNSLIISDIQSEKSTAVISENVKYASQVFFLNEQYIAMSFRNEKDFFEIIEITSNKIIATIPSNQFIGSTAAEAYFSSQGGSGAAIEKLDLKTKKNSTVGNIPGEVFGWYFSKTKGIVGVAVHGNQKSKIYAVENNKIGKSMFDFSSGFYFETKGCNSNGDVFYGITNFQSLTTYPCAISKTGIKPLNNKSGESCTDIFVIGNDIALQTNNINATDYQVSQNTTFQNILAFTQESFKGSSIQVLDFAEKNNTILFCAQGENRKPKYLIWQKNKAMPIDSDKYDRKNLSFISSEVVQLQTGENTPQTGRMYLPTKEDKSSYPLIIYIPKNIFLPYTNQFNPTVQHLCQSGYAVFVWNTRFSFRPKTGFSYSDLVGTFSQDIEILLAFLNKEYSILPQNTYIFGEGLGGYLALNASSSSNDSFKGTIVNRLNFPGKEFEQDLIAARLFGEDAQSKWPSLEKMSFSEKCFYLAYTSNKSNSEMRLSNNLKENKIKWTENTASSNTKQTIESKELDGILNWLQHLSEIEPKVFEDMPKVEVKKK